MDTDTLPSSVPTELVDLVVAALEVTSIWMVRTDPLPDLDQAMMKLSAALRPMRDTLSRTKGLPYAR